jgi:hypothetical protein
MNTDQDIFIVGRIRGGFDFARRVSYVDSVRIYITAVPNYYSQTTFIIPSVVSIKDAVCLYSRCPIRCGRTLQAP